MTSKGFTHRARFVSDFKLWATVCHIEEPAPTYYRALWETCKAELYTVDSNVSSQTALKILVF